MEVLVSVAVPVTARDTDSDSDSDIDLDQHRDRANIYKRKHWNEPRRIWYCLDCSIIYCHLQRLPVLVSVIDKTNKMIKVTRPLPVYNVMHNTQFPFPYYVTNGDPA